MFRSITPFMQTCVCEGKKAVSEQHEDYEQTHSKGAQALPV